LRSTWSTPGPRSTPTSAHEADRLVEIPDAVRYLGTGQARGKVVIRIG